MRNWISKAETVSPTVLLWSFFLTWTIDVKEGRDVMTADIPNVFIQADMPQPGDGEDQMTMKITGHMVNIW